MSAETLVSCPVRRRRAVHWAQRMLIPGRAVILDTETTDLGAEICEIAAIDTNGNPLLDTLVNPDPRGVWMHPDALRVHGIRTDMLREAPSTRTVLQQLADVVAGRHVLAYNARYDAEVIARAALATGVDLDELDDENTWGCIMRARSDAAGHPDHYLPLGGDHRALGDCLATLDVLRAIAATDLHAAA